MGFTNLVSNGDAHKKMDNHSTICMQFARIQSRGVFLDTNPFDFSLPLILAQSSMASLVILLTSRLLKPLGQHSTAPQILGGIILGPSILGQIDGFTETLFPLRGFTVFDTLSLFGFMFYFFLIGVQVDLSILKRIEKKEFAIGISTAALAPVLSNVWSFLVMGKMSTIEQSTATSLPIVATAGSLLSFPTIAQYLIELKMANSEFGQLAQSSSVVGNLFFWFFIVLTSFTNQQSSERFTMFKTVSSGIAMALVVLLVVRPALVRMLRRVPEGEPVREEVIFVVLIGVLLAGFCSEACGLNIIYGPLLCGLAIPAGPPLGSALVDKLHLLTSWMFIPLYFVRNGLVIDIFSVKSKNYLIVECTLLVAYTAKFIGALLSSLYFNIPHRDAVSLGLLVNVQGVLELGYLNMMKRLNAIDDDTFVVLCTSMLIATLAITPTIKYLYDPSKRYTVYKRRTILHSRPNSELRILTCIHNQENVPITINLVEAMNPTRRNPITVHVLHLMELVGRVHPLLIPHKLTKRPSSKASASRSIVNAFMHLQESSHGVISVQPFTSISPCATMHDEVCTMALNRKVSLVIVPFHKRFTANGGLESLEKGVRIVNHHILDAAPCSVAIIVDRGLFNSASRTILATWASYHVAVLFLGGADDREALALGARMAGQPNINLTLIRLLESSSVDNTSERKLDIEVVSEFRLNMAGNYRVRYREEVVMDGTGTVAVVRSMENNYELIIVGRRHHERSPLVLGVSDWNGETELGAIGELLASADFHGNSSILVVQQHTIVVNESIHENKREKFNLHLFQEIENDAHYLSVQGNVVKSSNRI